MKGKKWATIVIVVIVVAVLASLITANITGNVIKVNNFKFGKSQIYTKAEVDKKFESVESDFKDVVSGFKDVEDEIYNVRRRIPEPCTGYLASETTLQQINLAGENYDVNVITTTSDKNAKIKIGNVEKEILLGEKYNFGEVSSGSLSGIKRSSLQVYIKGIQHPKNSDDARIVMLELNNCVIK